MAQKLTADAIIISLLWHSMRNTAFADDAAAKQGVIDTAKTVQGEFLGDVDMLDADVVEEWAGPDGVVMERLRDGTVRVKP